MANCTPKNRIGNLIPGPFAEMDSLLNHFFTPVQSARTSRSGSRVPAAIWEDDDKLYVELDAPGVKAEDVQVTFDNGQLTLELERKSHSEETSEELKSNYIYHERRYGKASYAVALPESVDPESIDASLTDGVLRVSVAKLPEAQPRKIEVRKS